MQDLSSMRQLRPKKIPLRLVLIVPFVLQVVAAVALTGYLSWQSGQQAIDDLANQVIRQAGDRVRLYLDHYLSTPHLINQINVDAVQSGQLNLQDLPMLERHLYRQLRQFDAATTILFANSQGDLRGADRANGEELLTSDPSRDGNYTTYFVREPGDRGQIKNQFRMPVVQERPWYKAAIAAGRPTWSPVVQLGDARDLGVNASRPLYEATTHLQGVFSSNLDLTKLSEFLQTLQISRSTRIFITEPNGLLIATSTDEKLHLTPKKSAQFERRAASRSRDPIVSTAAQQLQTRFGNQWNLTSEQQFSFSDNDDRYFLRAVPYRDPYGLDWLVVLAVPTSDFTAAIQQNTRQTVILCLGALVVSLGLGLLTTSLIAKPIWRMSYTGRQLALGEWEQPIADSYIEELAVLARSFNQMTDHLQQSFDRVKTALQESEEKFTKVFRTSPHLIAISTFPDGRYLEVNDRFLEFFGYSREEVIGRTRQELGILIQPHQRQQVEQEIRTNGAFQNLELDCRTRSGEIRVLLGAAEQIELNGQMCIIATGQDITDRKRIEELLQRGQQQLRQITDAFPAYIAYLDTEQRYRFANKMYEKRFECDRASLYGRPIRELVSEAEYQTIQHPLEHALAGNRITYTLEQPHPQGTRWLEVTLVPDWEPELLGQRRQVKGCYSLSMDVSDRKRAEEALYESEQRFRGAFNVSPIGISICSLAGHFLQANQSFCDTCGYTEAELQARTFQDITHPDDLEADLEFYRQLLTGEILSYSLEKRYIHKDGRTLWGLLSVSVVRDRAAKLLYVVGQVQDISEAKRNEGIRQQAAANLAEQQAFLRQVLNTVPDSIYVRDRQGRYLEANHATAASFGLSLPELLNSPDRQPPDSEELRRFQATNQQVMETRQPMTISPEQITTIAGEKRWYHTVIHPFIDANGDVQGIIGSSTDITALIQAKESLRHAKETAEIASRSKSLFLANMSHELRTPLNAILGFAQLMQRETPLSQSQAENLEIIYRSGNHLLLLINDVLELSKIEAGRLLLHESEVDLHETLDTIAGMFSLEVAAKSLQFTCTTIDVPDRILTDANKLRQVLVNLVNNAVKFTDRGCVTLQISVPAAGSDRAPTNKHFTPPRLRFQIEDTGAGIAAAELDSLFEPFVQTRSGLQSKEGTGLGLAISHRYVGLMGGQLQVSSVPGQGSVFWFDLPLVQPTQRSPELPVTQLPPRAIVPVEAILPESLLHELKQQSVAWLLDLHHAAVTANAAMVRSLSEQLPPDQEPLATRLLEMPPTQLEQLITLTQQAIEAT